MSRRPAPLGVLTPVRRRLLEDVQVGRVRWLLKTEQAILTPRDREDRRDPDQTPVFCELMASGWAVIVPPTTPRPGEPEPVETPTTTTGRGEDALAEAAAAARKRKAAKA
jgi:hypothetical protein